CKCVDSIPTYNRTSAEVVADIRKCLAKQVVSYEMQDQLMKSLKNPGKDNVITMDTDENSSFYIAYYQKLERYMRDSCQSLRVKVATNEIQSQHSMSDNKDAMSAYNQGAAYSEKEDYADAIPYYVKALQIDSVFAFAWDNLGLCYRHTGELDKALACYKKSLEVDSLGETPMQNMAVVYEYQKKYDDALAQYKKLAIYYPGNPEVFYGEGMIYTYYEVDLEKGLDNMCKAYVLYNQMGSPYRSDAEKAIAYIYAEMKKQNKGDKFNEILKANNITTTN
ncbi:MAG TPA: tetratricopeptide repeat protein, partial [Bacteroidia bacterium]|nr:tetratricopeptide repeat protein [Bacteroidia bacterium]